MRSMLSLFLLGLLGLFLLPSVCGLGVSFPMWVINGNETVDVSSRMTIIVTNPAVYQWYDRIIVVDDYDTGLLSVDGEVLSPFGTRVAYIGDLEENRVTFPVWLHVNWSCCESKSFPVSVYIVYNTTEGFQISTGVGGKCAAIDNRGIPVPEFSVMSALVALALALFFLVLCVRR